MSHSRGFSTAEAATSIVLIVLLVGVGLWVFNRQSKGDETPALSGGESIDAPAAPEVTTASDLTAVEQSLEQLNVEAANSDNAELDVQANTFQ